MGHIVEQNPLVSIVTPTYNMAEFLEETIQSVLAQDYPSIEYTVMDGGSTDGTLALLERYRGRIRWFSGPDAGAADAINRGLQAASGSVCAWLNADDTYLPGAVRTAVEALKADSSLVAVFGQGYWVDGQGQILGRYPTEPDAVDALRLECPICQPACFMRREALERAGWLDARFRSAFDYELWIRLVRQGHFARIEPYLATSRMHPANTSLGQRQRTLREAILVQQRHFGYVPFQSTYAWCCNLIDHRDQFFQPLRRSLSGYMFSLFAGAWFNRLHPARYIGEWASVMRDRAGKRWWNDTWMAHTTGFRFRDCMPLDAERQRLHSRGRGAGTLS